VKGGFGARGYERSAADAGKGRELSSTFTQTMAGELELNVNWEAMVGEQSRINRESCEKLMTGAHAAN
jgi:hypothetical protein